MQPTTRNPITEFVERQGCFVIDGGLATTLEARGHRLDDELWSAHMLLDAPEEIRQVHADFLTAGADCIISSSYQASLLGFRNRGLSDAEGARLLRLSVQLAIEARDEFWRDRRHREHRSHPIVAASIGPYGAYLADGSEYTGRYGIGPPGLRRFHEKRWQILADTEAELLACETIPSRQEAMVLLQLLSETPSRWAWLSFSCRDGSHAHDGTALADLARACDTHPGVAAVGINCTAPEHISSLIAEARRTTTKPVIVYPNSGEHYHAATKRWRAGPTAVDWGFSAREWARRGAVGVGGCCRVGPEIIREMRRHLCASGGQRED